MWWLGRCPVRMPQAKLLASRLAAVMMRLTSLLPATMATQVGDLPSCQLMEPFAISVLGSLVTHRTSQMSLVTTY